MAKSLTLTRVLSFAGSTTTSAGFGRDALTGASDLAALVAVEVDGFSAFTKSDSIARSASKHDVSNFTKYGSAMIG